jgi:hypothetical protein
VVWGWCGAGTDFRDYAVAVNGAWALSGWVCWCRGDGEGSHGALCGTHPHGRAAHNLLTDQGVQVRTVDSRPSCSVGGPPADRG